MVTGRSVKYTKEQIKAMDLMQVIKVLSEHDDNLLRHLQKLAYTAEHNSIVFKAAILKLDLLY